MVMPPKIKSGDLVRMEDHTLGIWREQDIIKQVMRGEEIWKDNDKRIFAFNVCNSGKAEDVTELYRYTETENGCSYQLIWHRQPREIASWHSYEYTRENE